jgi:hypothetical protein
MVAENLPIFYRLKKWIIYHPKKKSVWEQEEGAIYATLVPTYLPTYLPSTYLLPINPGT